MHMIYTSFSPSQESATCWHPVIDETLARHLGERGLDASIAVARSLNRATGFAYRIAPPYSTEWLWGTDIPTRALVRARIDAAPRHDHRVYNRPRPPKPGLTHVSEIAYSSEPLQALLAEFPLPPTNEEKP
jgi:hypothetical protein